jgi:hypothetical protein
MLPFQSLLLEVCTLENLTLKKWPFKGGYGELIRYDLLMGIFQCHHSDEVETDMDMGYGISQHFNTNLYRM